jgi:general stress protein 26
MTEERKKLHELLTSFETVMLVTHRGNVELDARPMHVARVDENCDVWFLSGPDGKVAELRDNAWAQIVAQNKDDSWVSLAGRVIISSRVEEIDRLWSEAYKVWFPRGKEDPSIRVLHFQSTSGEYWDQRGANKVEYALKAAAAYVTGTTPNTGADEHGKVGL